MSVDIYTEKLPVRTGFGRHVEHDPRSRDFDISRSVAQVPIHPVAWPRHAPIFDQSNLIAQGITIYDANGRIIDAVGSCEGNAMAGLLASEPFSMSDEAAVRFNERYAIQLYITATHVDAFEGYFQPSDINSVDTGTSNNGVCKAAREMGLIRSWSWAFTTNGLLRGLMKQPAIAGIPFFESMYEPNAEGEVVAEGEIVGGHAMVLREWDGTYIWADQSWGLTTGVKGRIKFSRSTWEKVRKHNAEVTFPHV